MSEVADTAERRDGASPTDHAAFERVLRERVRGTVSFDAVTRGLYATDASNYQMLPVAVVTPLDEADAIEAVRTAVDHGVPVLPRGGGTSLAGQTVGTALVLDFSAHMNRVLEVDAEQRWARVEPGVVRDELNEGLTPYGLFFAPDPATSRQATVGGMIGNNSSGTRSIRYGKTLDHVLEAKVLLSDGSVVTLGEVDGGDDASRETERSRHDALLAGVRAVVEDNREEIESRFPRVMRRVSGYNLDAFVREDRWNLAKLFTGSEGTLGVLLEAKIRLVPHPAATALAVAHFTRLMTAIEAVKPIVDHGPSAVEILDRSGVELARANLRTAPLCDFIEGTPEAILMVETTGETAAEAEDDAHAIASMLEKDGRTSACPVFTRSDDKAKVWSVRKDTLGLLLGVKGPKKPLPFVEDAAVPVERLPRYIDQILAVCREVGADVAMYAHASVGLIHVRPILDLRRAEDIERMKAIAERSFQLVKEHGGAFSGEHGDGLARSAFVERFFGERIYEAFRRIKGLFDPADLMNPGKIVDPPPMDRSLRYGTDYRTPAPSTEYRYREDGSFAEAVHLCSGVGACRKTVGGTMCPSYMATRDEEHSTRGRANALRLAMSGQLGPDALTSRRLHDVLDLCLGCKACKAECPSNVDMAKLKGEFLQKHHDAHGTSLRDRLIGAMPEGSRRFRGWPAPLVNAVQDLPPTRWAMERFAGLDRRRPLPRLTSRRIEKEADRSGSIPAAGRPRVALFADTYMTCFEPSVGKSAADLLEACGYAVELLDAGCCQRPRISQGLLRAAKPPLARTAEAIRRRVAAGVPVVVCEPSCASALTDDLPDLLDDALGDAVRTGVWLLESFLDCEASAGRLAASLTSPYRSAVLHGHCHQKALHGTAPTERLLGRVADLDVRPLDAGCCGMAGAFGYETEHYDISRKAGEQRLFPALRALGDDTAILATGFSCRHQIEHFTGRPAVPPVEALRPT